MEAYHDAWVVRSTSGPIFRVMTLTFQDALLILSCAFLSYGGLIFKKLVLEPNRIPDEVVGVTFDYAPVKGTNISPYSRPLIKMANYLTIFLNPI